MLKKDSLSYLLNLLIITSLLLLINLFFLNAAPAKPKVQFKYAKEDIVKNDQALSQFMKVYGPKEAIQTLAQLSSQASFDCHQRAHQAGRLAYKLFGAQKAFREGSGECHSGYYHGTTEGYFAEAGTANLSENLSKLCTSNLNGFFQHQCYHGVGHGLMAWANYEINEALTSCDLLKAPQGQASCATGVFMENYTGAFEKGTTANTDHVTKFLSSDPQYPCNIVSDRYKFNCYFLQTSRMLQIFAGDFQKVARECDHVPEDYKMACFASMGRDVGGASRGNPELSIAKCSLVEKGEFRTACLNGAVQDYFWDPNGGKSAIDFCKILTDIQEKSVCYSTIIGRAKDILPQESERKNFCQSLETTFRSQCESLI